jgi:3-oxoacyl-[acyl-carrier protein] reductase
MGVVRTTWAATPHLKANGGGSILNISSISGLAASGNISYGAVKAAVIQLTQSHAKAMAADHIRVNCIAPGSIEFADGVWDQVKKNMPDMYAATLASIPYGRMGLPEEVGNVAAFLMSAPAYWTTGQTISVDGAQSL